MIKLSTRPVAAVEQDLITSAQEACDAYQKMLDLGYEISEMTQVIDNMKFARDTIKARGSRWYIENCDPQNTLGAAIGAATEALSTKKVEASMEGFFQDVWDRIVKWWNAFCDWIKNLFNGSKEKVAAENVEEAEATVKEIKAAPADKKAKIKKVITDKIKAVKEGPLKKVGSYLGGLMKKIHKRKNKKGKSSTEALTDEKIQAIEGMMPNLEGINVLSKQAMPKMIATLRDATQNSLQLITKAKSFKSREELDSFASELEKKMNDSFDALGNEFDSVIERNMIEAVDKDGYLTFEQIGVRSEADVISYVDGLHSMASRIKELRQMVVSWSDGINSTVKSLSGSQYDELRSELAKIMKDFSGESSEFGAISAQMESLCVALTEVGKTMTQALVKESDKEAA